MYRISTLLFLALVAIGATWAQVSPRIYGVRVYSEPTAPVALVSFSADNTTELKVEADLTSLLGSSSLGAGSVRGAACDGKTYYMIVSDDGMLPYRLVALDLESKHTTVIKEGYEHSSNPLGSIIVNDIAYNPTDGLIYGVGYDLESAEVSGSEIDAQMALFVIDPETGDSEIRGLQDFCAFTVITFNAYGELLGVDTEGNLWTISLYSGNPMDQVDNLGYIPVGTQGMATDFETGNMYWAAYTADDYNVPSSNLLRISMSEDWMVTVEDLGDVVDATELVGLYVDPKPMSESAPATPEDFKVTPGANGADKATLSWTNPSTTRGGVALTAVSAKVYANDEYVTTVEGTPGAAATYEYTIAEPGLVSFSVSAVSGDEEGARAYSDEVFVGTDRPGAVGSLTAKRADAAKYDITVAWEAPKAGAQGGWFDAAQLTYKVVRRLDGKVIAEATTATTVTDSDITATGAYIYDVIPSTGAGEGPKASTEPCVSGPAIVPPYTMNLSDENDANLWTVANGDKDEYMWTILNNWGGSDTSFRYYPVEIVGGTQETDDWLISPSFALDATKYYAMSYDLRLWGDLFPATYTVNVGQGAEPSALTQVLESRESVVNDMVWETRTLSFKVASTGDYNIGFGALLANPIEVKGVYLREIARKDLAAESVAGAVGASVDKPGTYTVTVLNAGYEAVSSYTVSLVDAEGTELASRSVSEELASMATAQVELEWTPTAVGTVSLHAVVTTENDLNADNDKSASINVAVLPDGDWHAITDGTSYSAFAPFYLRALHSGVQTIYTSEELAGIGDKIYGVEYYYMPMGSSTIEPFDVKLALANTEEESFFGGSALAEDEFTAVFEGVVSLPADRQSVTILFDTPYEYTGKNLCVQTIHNSTSTASMLFNASVPKDGALVTAVYYSDEAPYDFTHTNYYNHRPNISLFSTGASGLENVSAVDRTEIVYNRSAKVLMLNREAEVRVISLQGNTVLKAQGSVIDASAISGPAIVTTGDTTVKIFF